MEQVEEAQHELDRIDGIITQHQGFMFTLRGWLITVVGGLLVAYYTDNIAMSDVALRIALPLVAVLFWIVEIRHANLVESVVERARDVEAQIASWRQPAGDRKTGKYDGPKVSEYCARGAKRLWPSNKMTFILNLPFYLVVGVIIFAATVSLPPKVGPQSSPALAIQTTSPQ